MQPIVDGLEKEYGDRIAFIHVNILDPHNAAIMKQYNFSATPEMYLVDEHGQVIHFWDEAENEAVFIKAFDQALKKSGG